MNVKVTGITTVMDGVIAMGINGVKGVVTGMANGVAGEGASPMVAGAKDGENRVVDTVEVILIATLTVIELCTAARSGKGVDVE